MDRGAIISRGSTEGKEVLQALHHEHAFRMNGGEHLKV